MIICVTDEGAMGVVVLIVDDTEDVEDLDFTGVEVASDYEVQKAVDSRSNQPEVDTRYGYTRPKQAGIDYVSVRSMLCLSGSPSTGMVIAYDLRKYVPYG